MEKSLLNFVEKQTKIKVCFFTAKKVVRRKSASKWEIFIYKVSTHKKKLVFSNLFCIIKLLLVRFELNSKIISSWRS